MRNKYFKVRKGSNLFSQTVFNPNYWPDTMAFKATKDSISTTTFEGITIQAIGLALGYLDLKILIFKYLKKIWHAKQS